MPEYSHAYAKTFYELLRKNVRNRRFNEQFHEDIQNQVFLCLKMMTTFDSPSEKPFNVTPIN